MLDVQKYVQSYLQHEYQNDAAAYHVVVNKVAGAMYRAIGVHHFLPQENAGLHHCFMMVVDDSGKPVRPISVAWSWLGQHADQPSRPVPLDKPDNEPMGNIAMDKGQTITVSVMGTGPSDAVSGISTGWPDEGVGNTLYHHSFLVVWRASTIAPYTEPTAIDWDGLIFELQNAQDAVANCRAMVLAARGPM